MAALLTNITVNEMPETPVEDDTWFPGDKVYIGIGVGAGLLLSLTLLAIIGALACRDQHVRSGRRGRRLPSTVTMAYSDFDSYKAAKPHYIYTSSTPQSTISTNLTTATASTSHNTTFNDSNEHNFMMYKGWQPADMPKDSGRHHRSSGSSDPDIRDSLAVISENYRLPRNSAPEIGNSGQNMQPYDTKMLSPTYLNRYLREEQKRGIRKDGVGTSRSS